MSKEFDEDLYDENRELALKYFKRIYPEIKTISIVDNINCGEFFLIYVGDGYHIISENTVSEFYNDYDKAQDALYSLV